MRNVRVKYVDGSSIPHFEKGDGGPMTRMEAAELVNSLQKRRIAHAAMEPLQEYVRQRMPLDERVAEVAARVAREVMGSDRPLSDDDTEYYAFIDMLLAKVEHAIEQGLHEYISRPW